MFEYVAKQLLQSCMSSLPEQYWCDQWLDGKFASMWCGFYVQTLIQASSLSVSRLSVSLRSGEEQEAEYVVLVLAER